MPPEGGRVLGEPRRILGLGQDPIEPHVFLGEGADGFTARRRVSIRVTAVRMPSAVPSMPPAA